MTRFALEVARAALTNRSVSASISISRQNESFPAFLDLGDALTPVDTFSHNAGILLEVWRIPFLRNRVVRHIAKHRTRAVIELMPHVWSPFIVPAIKAAGVRYVSIIHDAITHPGDYRSAAGEWSARRVMKQADIILTLSSFVTGEIRRMGLVPHNRIYPVFHPDLDFGARHTGQPPRPGEPWRLLFFGRIMPYKGLPLFLDMIAELRERGISVQAGVLGEGDLADSAPRLQTLGAEVINRWLTEQEIADNLPRYHAIVLSHIEASQSGVAAAAHGAGLPVIATPVGGIIEQVSHGLSGVIAERVDARALASATEELLSNPDLYRRICTNLTGLRDNRSTANFVEHCVNYALYAGEAAS